MFDRYYSFGIHAARRYSSNQEDAKEILSNAFLRVYKKLHLFDPNQPFEGWFTRIIIHGSSDYYRYKKQNTIDIVDIDPLLYSEQPDIIDQLSYEELLRCIQKLTPQYRLVFNLAIIEGYKHIEIAEILKISAGTSKSNLSKAKKQLQLIIREKYEISSPNR